MSISHPSSCTELCNSCHSCLLYLRRHSGVHARYSAMSTGTLPAADSPIVERLSTRRGCRCHKLTAGQCRSVLRVELSKPLFHDIICKPFVAHVSLQLTTPRPCANQQEWRRWSRECHEPPRTVAAEGLPISATCGTSFPLFRFSSANLELLGRGQARLLST